MEYHSKFDELVEKILEEKKNTVAKSCWKGYERKGMKSKGKGKKKRMVPNCVPK
jgi:hypothetical protein